MRVGNGQGWARPCDEGKYQAFHACRDFRACGVAGLCRSLIADFNTDTFIPQAVLLLTRHLPFDAGVLFLYDDTLDRLVPASCYGYEMDALEHLALGDSIMYEVFDTGKPRVSRSSKRIREIQAQLTRSGKGSLPMSSCMVCVPLRLDSVALGCVVLESRSAQVVVGRRLLSCVIHALELLVLFVHKAQTMRQNQEKGFSELVSTLSHELRTPLTCIKGYTTTLLENPELDHVNGREFLEIIDSESDTMNNLIKDLMDSSLIEAGFLRIRKQPMLMTKIVHKAVENASVQTRKHRFVVSISQDFPVLEGDPDRMKQVLDNILDNAVKYSPEGGLIVINGRVVGREAIISIADQGMGIAPEDLNRLFEKFFRVKSEMAGTGLGLPVAHEIIEKHGGRIWAESAPGKGSTFFFALPLTDISRRNGGPSQVPDTARGTREGLDEEAPDSSSR
ncbi:MAG: ATP-binding protein [Bacillota bacterium]|jgi:signal transduction histidine kinase